MIVSLLLTAAAPPAAARPLECLPKVQRTERTAPRPMKRLGELPPSENYLAVLHYRDGCMVPIKARDRR